MSRILFLLRDGNCNSISRTLADLLSRAKPNAEIDICAWRPGTMGIVKLFSRYAKVFELDGECKAQAFIRRISICLRSARLRLLWHACNRADRWISRRHLIRLERQRQYDLVVVWHQSLLNRLCWGAFPNNKLVFWYHDSKPDDECNPRHYRGVAKVVTLTDYTQKWMLVEWGVLRERLHVVPNIIDLERCSMKAFEPLQDGLSRVSSVVNFVTVGRFSWEKGYQIALDCARQLYQMGLEFCWWFVGGGEEQRGEFNKLASGIEEAVRFVPFMTNPLPLVKACTVFVSPSKFESFGLVLGEAFVLGKPIIATRTAGSELWVRPSVNGEIVPYSSNALAKALRRCITEPEYLAELRSNAEKMAESSFVHDMNERAVSEFVSLLNYFGIDAEVF